jgi:hypothetical protein
MYYHIYQKALRLELVIGTLLSTLILVFLSRDNEDWFCSLCKKDEELRLDAPVTPEVKAPTPPPGSKRKAASSNSHLAQKELRVGYQTPL